MIRRGRSKETKFLRAESGCRRLAVVAVLLGLIVGTARAESTRAESARGTLAVFNAGAQGWQVAERAQQQLVRHLGNWAKQPGVAAFLAGRPSPGGLPSGRQGLELSRLVDGLRGAARLAPDRLFALGRLLGVDYLLVLRVRQPGLSARLFSVHRQRFAPQGYEAADQRVAPLSDYLAAQVRTQPRARERGWTRRWWIWAGVAALTAVAITLAATSDDDDRSGDLVIRIRRPR